MSFHSFFNSLFIITLAGAVFYVGKIELNFFQENQTDKAIVSKSKKVNKQPSWNFAQLPTNNFNPMPQKVSAEENFALNSLSGIVVDSKTKDILFSKQPDKKTAIASITKLMTALVVLESDINLGNYYTVQNFDYQQGGKIYVYQGEKVKIMDLLNISLVASGNTETMALAHSTGLTKAEFVAKMNEKAKEIGLSNTNFIDPTGLSPLNTSTARDVARLAQEAFKKDLIRNAVMKSEYFFTTQNDRSETVKSTDLLLNSGMKNGVELLGGKTGYLNEAGYCFVSRFMNQNNQEIIAVVLGANNLNARFEETKNLVEWIYANYEWK